MVAALVYDSLGVGVSPMRPRAAEDLPKALTAESACLIRVAIVSDSRLLCEGLRRILASDSSLVIVGEAEFAAAREVVGTTSPHILLMDVRSDRGLALYREMRRPWMILVRAAADEDGAVRALEAGARGILSETASAEDLIKAIRVVHEGQIWASKTVMARIVEAFASRAGAIHTTERLLAQRLSRREHEIMRHTARGLNNQEVAAQLGISEATVKAHLTHIFGKLGVRDRAQLTALYHRSLSPGSTGMTA
jgi:DNA-binding NarL/FixJ family response regulator